MQTEGWKFALVLANKQLSMQRILNATQEEQKVIVERCRGLNDFLQVLNSWVERKNRLLKKKQEKKKED